MKGKQATCVFDYCVFHTIVDVKKVEREVVVEVLKGNLGNIASKCVYCVWFNKFDFCVDKWKGREKMEDGEVKGE